MHFQEHPEFSPAAKRYHIHSQPWWSIQCCYIADFNKQMGGDKVSHKNSGLRNFFDHQKGPAPQLGMRVITLWLDSYRMIGTKTCVCSGPVKSGEIRWNEKTNKWTDALWVIVGVEFVFCRRFHVNRVPIRTSDTQELWLLYHFIVSQHYLGPREGIFTQRDEDIPLNRITSETVIWASS